MAERFYREVLFGWDGQPDGTLATGRTQMTVEGHHNVLTLVPHFPMTGFFADDRKIMGEDITIGQARRRAHLQGLTPTPGRGILAFSPREPRLIPSETLDPGATRRGFCLRGAHLQPPLLRATLPGHGATA